MKIGIQTLDAIKNVHRVGYIYCDLQPKNLIVEDDGNGDSLENIRLHLVDFSCARKYLGKRSDDNG